MAKCWHYLRFEASGLPAKLLQINDIIVIEKDAFILQQHFLQLVFAIVRQ